MQKPSKNVVALLIVCSTIVGVVIYVNSQPKNSPKNLTEENANDQYKTISIASGFNTSSESDIDNDNLKDWEEIMWKTDPQNPDSDEDGTKDGQEVLAQRNPLKKGPNDKLSDEDLLSIKETTLAKGFQPNSETDNFSKSFFQNYLAAKKEGIVNTDGENGLVQNMVQKAVTDFQSSPRYTKSELTTFSNDPQKAKAFGTSFALIQQQKVNDIYLAAKKNDLKAVALEYKKLGEALFALQVPEELADVHVQIINNLNTVYDSYTILNNYEKDPLKALFGIKEHKRIQEEQVKLYTSTKNYFIKNGIIFDNVAVTTYWANF